MFAIDGVKLPSNVSKERSGTHDELMHRARRLDKAADKIVRLHQSQDNATQEQPLSTKRQAQIEALRKEAARTREFVATTAPRLNRKGQELKSNVTDPDSAKMATGKGVIQGYAAQAAVDSAHQVIVAADVSHSGSEQAMLLPMIEQTAAYRQDHTLITADAGYHSEANVQEQGIPALVADNQMRQSDERFQDRDRYKAQDPLADKPPTGRAKPIKRFGPKDFDFHGDNTSTCPAGQTLASFGTWYTTASGLRFQLYDARDCDCQACGLRDQCLKSPQNARCRLVTRFKKKATSHPNDPIERMKRAIDSTRGRQLYSQRIGTVEPVFGNIRHNKRMARLNLRGREKVNTQWHLYCMVHNIEKLANSGWQQ